MERETSYEGFRFFSCLLGVNSRFSKSREPQLLLTALIRPHQWDIYRKYTEYIEIQLLRLWENNMQNLYHLLHLQVKEHPPKPYAPFANFPDRVSGSRDFLICSIIVLFYKTIHIQHVFETTPLPKCSQEVSDHIMVSLKTSTLYCFVTIIFFHFLVRHPIFVLYA